MPQNIELSDSTHSRLVELMGSNDTTESAVLLLLDFHKARAGKGRGASPSSVAPSSGKLHFTGAEPTKLKHAKLKHAKVLEAKINGLELPNAKWNTILSHLAENVFKNGVADSDVTAFGIVRGKKEDLGYKFLPNADISIRRRDANEAWRMSVELAGRLNADVFVEFEWRNKKKAEHPGKKADLKNR